MTYKKYEYVSVGANGTYTLSCWTYSSFAGRILCKCRTYREPSGSFGRLLSNPKFNEDCINCFGKGIPPIPFEVWDDNENSK